MKKVVIYRISRIALGLVATLAPIVFGDKIKNLSDWRYVSSFGLIVSGLLIVEAFYDRAKEEELRRQRERLERDRELGVEMERLLKTLIPILTLTEQLLKEGQGLNSDENRETVRSVIGKIDDIMAVILGNACDGVARHLNLRKEAVNANVMVAHEIARLSATGTARLCDLLKANDGADFREYRRPLTEYRHALELVVWAREPADVPRLVLPVEDPMDERGKSRLLPGAPYAFALRQDTVIPDTSELREHMPRGLAQDVQDKVVKYFEGRDIKSFLCLVLWGDGNPNGILNIQSNEANICGPHNIEKDTLIKSFEHYRFSVQYLLASQHKLAEAASHEGE